MYITRLAAYEERFGKRPYDQYVQEFILSEHGPEVLAACRRVFAIHPIALVEPLKALVNHGRWIVNCPTCLGSQFASRTERRFFCTTCLNQAAGGLWIHVDWPDQAARIEQLLLRRPNPANRNWYPHETIADLERENAQHLGEVTP